MPTLVESMQVLEARAQASVMHVESFITNPFLLSRHTLFRVKTVFLLNNYNTTAIAPNAIFRS